MTGIFSELDKEQAKQREQISVSKSPATEKVEQKSTLNSTQARDRSSYNSREKSRKSICDLPSRDEIQEFSFRLRDQLKVKVQAEVPHKWQRELDDVARDLNVRKLELYRFIIGEFLGKVKRRGSKDL